MHLCPQKHQSDTPDYCSVCGLEIPGTPADLASSLIDLETISGEKCPDCGAPRESPAQRFCDACGYNYRSKATSAPPVAGGAKKTSAGVVPPEGREGRGKCKRWDVVIQVDANLYGKHNADAPVAQPTQTFPLLEAESLIGRAGTSVRVQIPVLNDAGVSRRQALLIRQPDGGLALRDLGSANGTQLNGVDVLPGVDTLLEDGDVLGLGAWTRITIRAVSA
jgi:hypothetical protein